MSAYREKEKRAKDNGGESESESSVSIDDSDDDLYDPMNDPLYDSEDEEEMEDELSEAPDKEIHTDAKPSEDKVKEVIVEPEKKKLTSMPSSKRRLDFIKKLSSDVFIKEKVENRLIEMIWFGGISNNLSDQVFHAVLELTFQESIEESKS